MARHRSSSPRQYQRTDRIGELVREIVASQLERIGDERLEMVTVTAVDVDGALEAAVVYYSALSAEEDGRLEEVADALDEQRWRIQQVVNREVRARRTPQIRFERDQVLSEALRIEQILRDIDRQDDDRSGSSDTGDRDAGDEGAGDEGAGDEGEPRGGSSDRR